MRWLETGKVAADGTPGLHEGQHGFRPGKNTTDNIVILIEVIKARCPHPTWLMFLDIEKAYDSMWKAGLLKQLWHKGQLWHKPGAG